MGTLGLGFVGFSPNRILSATSVPLWQVDQPLLLAVAAVGAIFYVGGAVTRPRLTAALAVLAGAAIVFLSAFAIAGAEAIALVRQAGTESARVSLGGAFWLIILTSALAMSEALNRLGTGLALRVLVAMAIVAAIAIMAAAGWFDDLSIIREWANKRDEYATALGQHVRLVVVSLAIALAIGVPLGMLTALRPKFSGRVFAVLNIVQTIPSIALFGLLIGPLTALSDAIPGLRELGVRGIGFTPAVIALVLYGLLPIARNTQVGLLGVPASVVDAARGMGMTEFQIMTRVSIPLALPVLLAGLRFVTVQTIGLAVVAALIGAGGFGSFVFLGLGQTATDLVLLGALSAILMSLVADAGLRLLTLALTGAEAR